MLMIRRTEYEKTKSPELDGEGANSHAALVLPEHQSGGFGFECMNDDSDIG